jgi:uncharacterized membrane protein YhaH (DUF805 family)
MWGLLGLFFSAGGRIARGRFWLGLAGLLVLAGVFNGWLLGDILGRDLLDPAAAGLARPALQFAVLSNLIWAYPLFSLLAKRFHDRNKGAVWAVPLVLAYLGMIALDILSTTQTGQSGQLLAGAAVVGLLAAVWIVIELGALKGTSGANHFGPDPLSG